MKLIVFAIWGNNLKYLIGAVKNAQLASVIYPSWKCRFYVDSLVPESIIYQLEQINNTEVVRIYGIGDWKFSFNRFLPISEPGIKVMISRDADSRLNKREKAAVDDWMKSDKGFHIMKDHPWHFSYPILAGMFGCKSGTINNISEQLNQFDKTDWYHSDQEFLKQHIYPAVSGNICYHDDFHNSPFPTRRKGTEHVGQVFDEQDNNVAEHTEAIRRELNEIF